LEIHTLSLGIGQEELNDWARQLPGANGLVRGLSLSVGRGGIHLCGEVNALTWVSFDAEIEAAAEDGVIVARVAGIQAGGFFPLPASITGMIMGMVGAEMAKHPKPWLRVEENSVILNVETLLQSLGVSLTANLSGVRCGEGVLFLEAQPPAARTPPGP